MMPATPQKPAGVKRLWGMDGHMYVFKVPAQTVYWSQGGVLSDSAEVAFEYEFDSSDIVAYWAPRKNFVLPPGKAPDPQKKFSGGERATYLVLRTNG
jgi:hypothetical protein